VQCVKRFLGYAKFDSLTSALLRTGLPSANTVLYNYNYRFYNMTSVSSNCLVRLVCVCSHVTVQGGCVCVCDLCVFVFYGPMLPDLNKYGTIHK